MDLRRASKRNLVRWYENWYRTSFQDLGRKLGEDQKIKAKKSSPKSGQLLPARTQNYDYFSVRGSIWVRVKFYVLPGPPSPGSGYNVPPETPLASSEFAQYPFFVLSCQFSYVFASPWKVCSFSSAFLYVQIRSNQTVTFWTIFFLWWSAPFYWSISFIVHTRNFWTKF